LDIRGEIITIGNELIAGAQVDTNSAYLAEKLQNRGISVQRIISIGDDAHAIATAVKESIERAELILITGGLGPTSDDITTETAARILKIKLKLYPEVW